MLCKVWGYHGGHYEKCRLLGCQSYIFTPQKTEFLIRNLFVSYVLYPPSLTYHTMAATVSNQDAVRPITAIRK
jgi:hypothetical protein